MSEEIDKLIQKILLQVGKTRLMDKLIVDQLHDSEAALQVSTIIERGFTFLKREIYSYSIWPSSKPTPTFHTSAFTTPSAVSVGQKTGPHLESTWPFEIYPQLN